jgi:hypothetical protein
MTGKWPRLYVVVKAGLMSCLVRSVVKIRSCLHVAEYVTTCFHPPNSGTSFMSIPGMRFCLDCVGRCFEQEVGKCVAILFNASTGSGPTAMGTCTHFSSLASVSAGKPTDVIVVAGKHIPHDKN